MSEDVQVFLYFHDFQHLVLSKTTNIREEMHIASAIGRHLSVSLLFTGSFTSLIKKSSSHSSKLRIINQRATILIFFCTHEH